MRLSGAIDRAFVERHDAALRECGRLKRELQDHVLSLCPVGVGDLVETRARLRYRVEGCTVSDSGTVMPRCARTYKEGSRRAGGTARASTHLFLSDVEPVE